MRKSTNAFTIIELLVVIAVIGILATISIVGFSRFQASARDAQRSSKTATIAESLEKYYDANGEYPSCSALTTDATTVSKTVLTNIDTGALLAPQATSAETNSLRCTDLTGNPGEDDYYAYIGDSSTACASGLACLQFTLKYRDESTGTIISIESRRQTAISTSGTPAIVASSTGFNTVAASWSAVTNAMSYTLQRANNSNFTSGLVETTHNGASNTVTGLSYGTTYYFRVKANSPSSVSPWSNTNSVTTWSMSTPSVAMTADSPTQVTANWNDITHANSYNIQYSTSSSFSSGVTTTTSTVSTKALTGLSAGTTYYVRVQGVNGSNTSSWGTGSITTTVQTPSGTPSIAASMASASVARGSAGSAGSCSAGTTLSYQMRYHSTNVAADGSWSGWTSGTTRDVTALQGNKYTFQVQARCDGSNASSSYNTSGTANIVRSIDTPSAPGWATTTEWAAGYNYRMSYSWSCPSGTNIGSSGVSSNSGGASQATPWIDWWYVGWNNGQYDSWHTYNAVYTCQTAYWATNSPTTSTTIHAYCDPSRRSFSSYPRCDNYGQGQAGNGNGNY